MQTARPAADASPTAGTARRTTPGLLLGPFYPLDPPCDGGPRLWLADAVPPGARRLALRGRVESLAGDPVVGARVELWHADPWGRYRHPSAPGAEHVDPAFAGYGVATTDADGRFAFDSLEPGGYLEGTTRRAPHLHVQVTGRFDRLVTQVAVTGASREPEDRWFAAASRPWQLRPAVVRDDPDLLLLEWTAVVRRG